MMKKVLLGLAALSCVSLAAEGSNLYLKVGGDLNVYLKAGADVFKGKS